MERLRWSRITCRLPWATWLRNRIIMRQRTFSRTMHFLRTFQARALGVREVFTSEPNNMPLAVGDVVEEPHHYASKNFLSYDALSSYIPSTGAWGTGGFYVGFNGAGIVGSSNVLLTSAAPGAIEFNNNNPSGMYQYWGGVPRSEEHT